MSIFKRLFRDKDDTINNSVPVFKPQHANIKAMGSNLQRRFARGVQYNMKILIRGDRNVGKSSLLNRLKGQDFVDQYIPTEEIEVACIHWTYKTNEDVVKVEVWDVVDKGRKKFVTGLKLENNGTIEEAPKSLCLDAEFLDVYKGAHGVIIVLDMTKSWTFNYVERELAKIPEDVPVLVLANHRDMGHHRTITADQVMTIIEPLPGYRKGLIKYWESSMKNGYGLVYIHKFLNIPFLMLQRDTLLKQLATNEGEMKSTIDDLEEFEDHADSTYESFMRTLKSTRASSPPPSAQKPVSLALRSHPASQINSPSSPISRGAITPASIDTTSSIVRSTIHPPQARPIPGMDKLGLYPLPVPTHESDVPAKVPMTDGDDRTSIDDLITASSQHRSQLTAHTATKKEVFDFVPEEPPELSTFLDDPASPRTPDTKNIDSSSSEEVEETLRDDRKSKRSNPMVAVFQDDIDEEDIEQLSRGQARIPPATSSLYNGMSHQSDSTSSDDHNDQTYVLPSRRSNDSNASGTVTKSTVSEVSSTKSLTTATITSGTEDLHIVIPYSEITFDATDLDILARISSKKEQDQDQITVDSTASSKKKHKSKKHHKQSESKESGTKKHKKKRPSRHSIPADGDNNNIDKTPNNGDHKDHGTTRHSIIPATVSGSPGRIAPSVSSDSLEKFLND